jgi:hypothetical protein
MGELDASDAGPDLRRTGPGIDPPVDHHTHHTDQVDPGEDFATLEQARLRGAARAVRGMFAGTLCLEAFTVVLVPRTVAQFGTGLTTVKLAVLLVLAALLVVVAFLQRRRWGTPLGSVLQVGVIGCGVLTGAMYALGGIFALIWLYELRLRRELLTPRSAPPS